MTCPLPILASAVHGIREQRLDTIVALTSGALAHRIDTGASQGSPRQARWGIRRNGGGFSKGGSEVPRTEPFRSTMGEELDSGQIRMS
jgi:hypothetical protein